MKLYRKALCALFSALVCLRPLVKMLIGANIELMIRSRVTDVEIDDAFRCLLNNSFFFLLKL